MSADSMTTHTIGNNTFAIFSKEVKGGVWSLHFIWGKKDFRLFLGRKGTSEQGTSHGPVLHSEGEGEVVPTSLQYLYAFEWFDYNGVSGHGLALEEVGWKKGKMRRYVELPKNFFDIAVELACREFDLKRADTAKAG